MNISDSGSESDCNPQCGKSVICVNDFPKLQQLRDLGFEDFKLMMECHKEIEEEKSNKFESRERKYIDAITVLGEGNATKCIQQLEEVANDEHPIACVLLWIFYDKIQLDVKKAELYKDKTTTHVVTLENMLRGCAENRKCKVYNLIIALQWCNKHGLQTEGFDMCDY